MVLRVFFKPFVSGMVVLCFVTGCRSWDQPPAEVIRENDFVSLTVALHLSEMRAHNQRWLPQDSMQQLQAYLWKDALKRHEVNDSLYHVSVAYYAKDPQRLEELYARVADSLRTRSGRGENK